MLLCIGISLTAQEWEQVSSFPDGFTSHHSFGFSFDGIGYIVSGGIPGNGYSANFYSYDPTTDEWTRKGDFPGGARGFAIGEVYNGKAYFGFGASNNGNLSDWWEYDPQTDAWTELASCDCSPRTHPAMVALNGKIYVGLGGNGGNLDDWWEYDIDSDTWSEKTKFPAAPRHHPFQFTDGEYVYAGFGHGSGFISNQWYRYDQMNDTWSEMATLPAEGRVAGTQFSYDGKGYVLSGDGDNHSFMDTGEFWQYDSEEDSWLQLTPHPGVSRWAPGSFIINDEVYIINGTSNVDGYIEEIYKFNLSNVNDPRLTINGPSEMLDLNGAIVDGYCNGVSTTFVEVATPFEFDTDVNVSLDVDDSSSAIEGVDFELMENSGVLTAGDKTIQFEVLLFTDAVQKGDRTIVINLESDSLVAGDQATVTIAENVEPFSMEVGTTQVDIAPGNTTTNTLLRQYYTTGSTQILYRKSDIEDLGLEGEKIGQLSFDVTVKGSTAPFNDVIIQMGTTSSNQLVGQFTDDVEFVEVFRGDVETVIGMNTIVFDNQFIYDGTDNLIIQFCFDNDNWTNDDRVRARNVGYNALVNFYTDGGEGCIDGVGEVVTSNLVPSFTLGNRAADNLYGNVGRRFQSTLSTGENAYFYQSDSILTSISAIQSSDFACMGAMLSIDQDEVVDFDSLVYINRVLELDHDGVEDKTLEVTLIVPTNDQLDWESEEIVGLYTPQSLVATSQPEWQSLDVIAISSNDKYTFVTVPFVQDGSYAVGMTVTSTSTNDPISLDQYTDYMITDMMGREIAKRTKYQLLPELPTGVYVKTYLQNSAVVKSEKIFID